MEAAIFFELRLCYYLISEKLKPYFFPSINIVSSSSVFILIFTCLSEYSWQIVSGDFIDTILLKFIHGTQNQYLDIRKVQVLLDFQEPGMQPDLVCTIRHIGSSAAKVRSVPPGNLHLSNVSGYELQFEVS